jgi:hypothetical protein
VWFRSKGRVKAEIVFNAFAKLSFHSGQVELFGRSLTDGLYNLLLRLANSS